MEAIGVGDDRKVLAIAFYANLAKPDRRLARRGIGSGPAAIAGFMQIARHVERDRFDKDHDSLFLAGKAHAFLRRRGYVTPDDIRALGLDVLRHRVHLTYEAEAENVTSEDVVRRIFDTIEVP